MNDIKKILGILWIILGCLAAYYIISQMALPKVSSGKGEDLIAGIIYFFIAPIIAFSLIIFGYYSLKGEYKDEE